MYIYETVYVYIYSTMLLIYNYKSGLVCAIYMLLSGFYLEILFWGGNMVDKDSKKGHNTLLCTVGAFATSQL